MKIRIGMNTYRFSFARPGNLAEDFSKDARTGDIGSGRRSGAAWKSVLADSIVAR
jgi:hypothetical protein